MAVDSALLRWVSRAPARLVLRTYGWDRPTLSLGRSEPFPSGWDARAIARDGVTVVRRPTGGNAVLHWEEIAFAIAASIPGPWRFSPRGFANTAADALAEALRRCGVPASRAESLDPGLKPPRPGASLCFARTDAGEVRASGYKVAGLASRFARGGALCHASVPLTARHRRIAAFRSEDSGEEPALERVARSVGELLTPVPDAAAAWPLDHLATEIADHLAEAVATRFGTRLLDTPLETVGLDGETVLEAASEVPM
jgi:lipoate-protein ligase A